MEERIYKYGEIYPEAALQVSSETVVIHLHEGSEAWQSFQRGHQGRNFSFQERNFFGTEIKPVDNHTPSETSATNVIAVEVTS